MPAEEEVSAKVQRLNSLYGCGLSAVPQPARSQTTQEAVHTIEATGVVVSAGASFTVPIVVNQKQVVAVQWSFSLTKGTDIGFCVTQGKREVVASERRRGQGSTTGTYSGRRRRRCRRFHRRRPPPPCPVQR